MWRSYHEPVDVAQLWAEEEKLTRRQRRARYRCGDRFVTLSSIPPWTVQQVQQFPDIHNEPPKTTTDEKEKEAKDTSTEENTTPAETTQSSTEGESNKAQGEAESVPAAKEEQKEGEENKQSAEKDNDSDDSDEDEDEEEIKSDDVPTKRLFEPNAELNRKVCIWQGDITRLEIDAVVNAANTSLLGGGGIDGAIHRAAGPMLLAECETLNGCETGNTKITRGYNLPAKYVLHTVGPIGENPAKLESCYRTCLELVEKYNIRSVAFCGVSTGIYGYPLYPAARIALSTVRKWLEKDDNKNKVDRIIFCTFLDKEQVCYTTLMPEYFPPAYDAEFYKAYMEKKEQEEESDDDDDEEETEADNEEGEEPASSQPKEEVAAETKAESAETPASDTATAQDKSAESSEQKSE